MFIPLSDHNPHRHINAPYVTFALIGINLVVFLLTTGLVPSQSANANMLGLGLIPAVVTDQAHLARDLVLVPTWATWLTYMFMHAGWMHLIGNMLFLWVFGDNVEDMMGHWRFALFFVLCGVASALLHAVVDPDSVRPLIGASGAISGVIAAYLLLFPRVRVWGLVLKYIPVRIPAWLALGGWILVQFVQAFAGLDTAVGWFAHIGGAMAGLALAPLLVRRDISIRSRWVRGAA